MGSSGIKRETPLLPLHQTMARKITTAIMMAASTKALTRGAFNRLTPTALLGSLLGANGDKYAGAVMGTEDIMKPKAHGTSATPVQKDLRWNCDAQTADRICNFNRHYAEFAGYWEQTSFLKEESEASGEISFYDSNTGNELFTAQREKLRAVRQGVARPRLAVVPRRRGEL